MCYDNEENEKRAIADFKESLSNPSIELVFEKHGWKNAKDFINDILVLKDSDQYFFLIKTGEEKIKSIGFANTLLEIMCTKYQDRHYNLTCNVISSDDERNHFLLLRTKK